jgi:hypothetical protein
MFAKKEDGLSLSLIFSHAEPETVQKLLAEGITVELAELLRVFPLAMAAWGDGHLDAREREAFASAAEDVGISLANSPFSKWLTMAPTAADKDQWVKAANRMCGLIPNKEKAAFLQSIFTPAWQVAKASGGTSDLSSISASEFRIIKELRLLID